MCTLLLQSKLQRANQSTSQASNPDATLSNYLHFGRLIGEQPAEIEAALNSKSVQYERDLGADEYLER